VGLLHMYTSLSLADCCGRVLMALSLQPLQRTSNTANASGTQVRGTIDIDDTTSHEFRRFERQESDGFAEFLGLRDAPNSALVTNVIAFG